MVTFFITGIDTSIGKTRVTGLAARYLHRHGKKVFTQKLVQTGQDKGSLSEDILEHRRLMEINLLPEDLPQSLYSGTSTLTCPYSFSFPASPHLAAHLEDQTIDPRILIRAAQTLQDRCDVLLIEGAGGFLVPLTNDLLTADYIAQQKYPVIVVTSGKLGSINHTLLTLESIHRRNLLLACLVVNQYPSHDTVIGEDTLRFFRQICSQVVVVPVFDANEIPEIDFSCLL